MLAYGYRPDRPDQRTQKDARTLLRAVPPPPPTFSLETYERTPTLDQNKCGSCIGHGTSQGLIVSFAAAGDPLVWTPSPQDLYALARCVARAANGSEHDPLLDTGASPADVMTAISTYGIRAMRGPSPQGFDTDVDPSNVNVAPDLLELREDAAFVVVGEYRIDETALDLPEQIMQVVSHGTNGKGAAVGIGVQVDAGFEAWTPDQGPLTTYDPSRVRGGHWLALTSYTTLPDQKRVFRGPNSWRLEDGSLWGDRGHYAIHEDWLRAALVDCYPLTVERRT